METKLLNSQGDEIGKIELPDDIFNVKVNKALLWEHTKAILANQRKGTAKTKSRAEVRGGGKKPWRQKGTGWARHGSIRSPIWRKGGVVFGPKPRDYYTSLPERKKRLALLSALSALAKENRILVIENFEMKVPKTKMVLEVINKINPNRERILIGLDKFDENLKMATRNVPYISLKRCVDINCYDVLRTDLLLLTNNGLNDLRKRCATKR
uniref:Large ribosomal subunit protein uL4 n=1 Tax=candidate division WOR-3 bacterium TaxID=2052148 RepID=A0A7C4TD56_UNCW3